MAKTQTQSPAPSAAAEDAAKTLSPARQSLKDTLEAKQRAIALAGKAEKVYDAARAAAEEALGEAGKYVGVDEDAVKERLAFLKGESGAKSQEEIREARRARIVANEEANAAKLVLQAAQRELEEARGNVDRAQLIANSHATRILSEITTTVIAAWDNVNLEREKLRTVLKTFVMSNVALETLKPEQRSQIFEGACKAAGLPFGDYRDWEALQNKAGAALSHNYAPQDPGPSIARARAYWASVANAVLENPAAELDRFPLPSAEKLFG